LVLTFCSLTALVASSSAQSVPAASSPETDLADFRLDEVQTKLAQMPAGPERNYIAGLLANHLGQDRRSIDLLKRALPPLLAARDARASMALKILADDYTKTLAYAAAAKAYDDLSAFFPEDAVGGIRDDAGVLHLLSKVQPMTVDWHGSTHLKVTRNAIGSKATKLMVNGIQEEWLLDTGANYSVVSKSYARRLGLTLLPGVAQTGSGLTGLESPLQAGILPSIQVGGATVHNVVVLVLDDKNLKIGFGDQSFQINAILGYPVFRAMQVITFTRAGEFEAEESARREERGIPMYMRRLTPVVAFTINSVALPFTLDTGASATELSVRYYDRFKDSDLSWKQEEEDSAGTGGNVRRRIYVQPLVDLQAGDMAVILKDVSIAPTRTNSGLDELYGNVGQDLFDEFESFTLDFANMRFKLGPPISPPAP